MKCEATVRRVHGVAVVDVNGPLTLGAGADTVREVVGNLIEDGERQILVNCAGITQVDSAGVGELVSCHSATARREIAFKLAGVRDRLANLVTLTGLDIIIESFVDVDSAVASFAVAKG